MGCPGMGAAGGSWPAAKGDAGAAGAIGGGTGAALGAGTVIWVPQEHFACLPANESSSV
jgi:hypothetical protein